MCDHIQAEIILDLHLVNLVDAVEFLAQCSKEQYITNYSII